MGTFDRYENFKINELGYFRELMKMSEFEKMTSESMNVMFRDRLGLLQG